MAETLTDTEIAVLCDIGQASAPHRESRSATIERLLAAGYLAPGKDPRIAPYVLTEKATTMLTERGVGLNEA